MTTTLIQNKPLYDGMKVTREEYLDLEDDGYQYDMIDGVLTMSPSPFFKHNDALLEIATQFRIYFRSHKIGTVIAETDVYLSDNGDVLRPDITIILKENYHIIKGHIHGIPDIVVEVLSEATRKRDLGIKADRYLSNGVKEYWIIDPDEKTIALWINVDKRSWNKKEGNVLKSSVLSGFVLKQEEVFPKQ
jgi:Uma2 family endonuclease